MMERVGEQYGGYHLIKKLGAGKTGEVYLSELPGLSSPVALRLLPTNGSTEEQERLLAQASRIAALDHPHVLKLLDAFIQDGKFVIVSRYTPHGNLLQYHPKGSQLSLERILPYVWDCAAGLDYLHEHGLLHLDVKPENMLLSSSADIWLSNIGLGSLLQPRTRDGAPTTFIGTPLYAAPEQFAGKPEPASDQYALAMTIYLWLVGKFPWQGDLAAILAQKRRGPPPLGPLFPPTLQAEKQARERYDLARAVQEQVRPHIQRLFPQQKPLTPIQEEEVAGGPPVQTAPWVSAAVESVLFQALAPAPGDRFPSVSSFVEALARASQPPLDSYPVAGETLFTRHNNGSLYSAAWAPNGRQIASLGLGQQAQVWDATTGRLLAAFPGSMRVAWAPDSRRLATGGEMGHLAVWAVAPAQRLFVCAGTFRLVTAITWSPDGQYIAASGDSDTIHLWNSATGENANTYVYPAHRFNALAWSPDGRWIASGGSETTEGRRQEPIIYVLEALTGQHRFTCRGHAYGVTSLAWSPDGSKLASAGADGTFHLWDAATGEPLPTTIGQGASVLSVAWSPDGKRIASGGTDKRPPQNQGAAPVHIWDAATGDCLLTYEGHYRCDVRTLSWSPNGSRIASVGNLNVRVWWAG